MVRIREEISIQVVVQIRVGIAILFLVHREYKNINTIPINSIVRTPMPIPLVVQRRVVISVLIPL